MVSDDALNTGEVRSIAGPSGDGVRFAGTASVAELAAAKPVVTGFHAQGYAPEGFNLNACAALLAFAAAATGAGSTDGLRMAGWLRANHAANVIADPAQDGRGDMTGLNHAWAILQGGKYLPEPVG